MAHTGKTPDYTLFARQVHGVHLLAAIVACGLWAVVGQPNHWISLILAAGIGAINLNLLVFVATRLTGVKPASRGKTNLLFVLKFIAMSLAVVVVMGLFRVDPLAFLVGISLGPVSLGGCAWYSVHRQSVRSDETLLEVIQ